MFKIYKITLVLLVLLFVLAGCGGSSSTLNSTLTSSPTSVAANAQIYIAGFYQNGNTIPCYWSILGGVATEHDLQKDASHDAAAYSIYASGSNVYIAGDYNNGTTNIPCYWVGTTKYDLGTTGGHAQAIYVSGNTVYIAGFYSNSGKQVPCYWTDSASSPGSNINRVALETGSGNAAAQSIYISNGTVYTAGYYNNGSNDIPCYWNAAQKNDLGTNPGHVQSIYGANGAVYIAGYYNNGTHYTPCFWDQFPLSPIRKDLSVPNGTNYAYAWSMYITGNCFYIAGYYNKGSNIPCYWLYTSGNTILFDLPAGNGDAVAQSISYYSNTVFTAGFYTNGSIKVPCYWTNSIKNDLPVPSGGGTAEAQSIFVQ